MSDNYKRVKTSYAVWSAIRKQHPELRLFSSYTAPEKGITFTSYGFPGSDFPIMEAETTWDTNAYGDETHQYWLCLPVANND